MDTANFSASAMRAVQMAQGFDEYMNLVLDEAEEVSVKRQTRKTIGTSADLNLLSQPCVCPHG
jgi:LSM domain